MASHHGKENFKQKQNDLTFSLISYLHIFLRKLFFNIKSLKDRSWTSAILPNKLEIVKMEKNFLNEMFVPMGKNLFIFSSNKFNTLFLMSGIQIICSSTSKMINKQSFNNSKLSPKEDNTIEEE